MTDLDLDAGMTPRAMADANETVQRLRTEVNYASGGFRWADAERLTAVDKLEAFETRHGEFVAGRPRRIADAEAGSDVAKAEVERLKAALTNHAPEDVTRLTCKATILAHAAAQCAGVDPAKIVRDAGLALVAYNALDPAGDELSNELEAISIAYETATDYHEAVETSYAAIRAIAERAAEADPRRATAALAKAEGAASAAQSAITNAMNDRDWLDGELADLSSSAAAATAIANARKMALDDASVKLSNAVAALAALEEADAPMAAADNAEFTMLKVRIEHEAYGDGNLSVCAWDYEPTYDEDDDGEEERDDDDPRIDAVRICLGTAHAFCTGLGAVRCDGAAGDETGAATYWLGINGEGWRPAGMPKGATSFELGGYDAPLLGLKGARLRVRCIAEPVLPSDAYASIVLRREGGDVGRWGGEPPEEILLPHPCENRRSWFYGISQWPEDMDRRLKRLAKLNNDVAAYMSCLNLLAIDDAEWAVEARLAYGALTLLVGDGGAGKSTWAHELFAATNAEEGPKEWAGGKVHAKVAGMAGEEDTPHQLMRRQERFAHAWGHEVDGPVFQDSGPESFAALLEWMGRLPDYSVVTIDHASAYTDGDLTQSHVAAAFLGPLNKIAKRKKLAVLLLHHFNKSAPREAERMAQAIAGSATVKNLVRVVLSLTELADGRRSVTVVKSNIDGLWLRKNESQIFQSDPESWRLLPVVPEAAALSPARGPSGATYDAIAELVFAAVARLNREGIEVHKSGRNDLHSLRLPELEGIGRDRLRNVIDGLILVGLLGRSENGLVANISTEICGNRMQS